MARQSVVDRFLRRKPQSRSPIRAVPTIVRRTASFLGNLIKQVGRTVGSLVGRRR